MKTFLYIFSLAASISLISCDIKKSNISTDSSFTRVYESTNLTEKYYPEDIIQLESGEYLVVSTLKDSTLTFYPRISIAALAADGTVISSVIPDEFVRAVPQWLQIDGRKYLVCMEANGTNTKIIEVTYSGGTLSYTDSGADLDTRLPLYSWSDGNDVVILSFDIIGRRSQVDIYDANFNQQYGNQFRSLPEDDEELILQHLKRQEEVFFPFIIGAISEGGSTTGYFVNCLDDVSLSLIFLDAVGSMTGSLSSHHKNGISSAICLEADTFAVSRNFEGVNYVYPRAGLQLGTIGENVDEFDDIELSNLKSKSAMDVIRYELDGVEYIVYGATTSKDEVILLFFDAETGEQGHSRIIGAGTNFRVVQLLETNDNGLAILGETLMGGQTKLNRMAIMKLTADQLSFSD